MLLVEVQLVELCEGKVKLAVLVVVDGGGVLRIVNRTVCLNHGSTLKHV